MRSVELEDRYFEWLYDLVCNSGYVSRLSYRKLLSFLHSVTFYSILPRDENRAYDGIKLRYDFGDDNGIPRHRIQRKLDNRPCSFLEMAVALSRRCEVEIMYDYELGNRTWKWFWKIMTNMNLGGMTDDKFDADYVNKAVETVLTRTYEPNGRNGYFTIPGCPDDLRKVEIWGQLNRYINSTTEV